MKFFILLYYFLLFVIVFMFFCGYEKNDVYVFGKCKVGKSKIMLDCWYLYKK